LVLYTLFKTKWGYFGLAGTEKGLVRSCLPLVEAERVKAVLLNELTEAEYEKNLFRQLQEQITAYFAGSCVNFGPDVPIRLDGLSVFARRVLRACRQVKFGSTISYGELARKAGHPGAARAVGGVMSKNPLPLIIPCHRVISSDGRIGGFSAQGGTRLKNRLLQFEREIEILQQGRS